MAWSYVGERGGRVVLAAGHRQYRRSPRSRPAFVHDPAILLPHLLVLLYADPKTCVLMRHFHF